MARAVRCLAQGRTRNTHIQGAMRPCTQNVGDAACTPKQTHNPCTVTPKASQGWDLASVKPHARARVLQIASTRSSGRLLARRWRNKMCLFQTHTEPAVQDAPLFLKERADKTWRFYAVRPGV